MIDGYGRFNDLMTTVWTKAEKVDPAKFRKVAKEPFATETATGISENLKRGFSRKGKVVDTISAVTSVGNVATIKTCFDQTHTKFINPSGGWVPTGDLDPVAGPTLVRHRQVASPQPAGHYLHPERVDLQHLRNPASIQSHGSAFPLRLSP